MLRLPERIHKRPFVISISVLVALAVITGILVFILGLFGSSANLIRVHVSQADSNTSVNGTGTPAEGIGINLTYLPTANLIKNPSFENKEYDQVYTVSGGTENAVYVESNSKADNNFDDDFFVGGTVQIMSLGKDGKLVPKMQANVTDFKINQLGLWTSLTVPAGAAEGQKITALSSSSAMTVAVGDKGLLISDVTSSEPAIINLAIKDSFVSCSCVLDRFYAVTEAGTFVTSADGKTWNTFSPDETKSYTIHTVSSLGKTGIAAGDSGAILICSGGKVAAVPSGTDKALMTSAGDGNCVIFAGLGGTVLTTSNGVVFRKLSTDEMPKFADPVNWECSDYRSGYFLLGGDKGQIALGTYSDKTGRFSFTTHYAADESGKPLSISHILMLSSKELIVMDAAGSLYCSSDNGDTWKLLSLNSSKVIDEIGLTSSGKILLSQGVTSQTTQLFTRIQFDEALSENIFQAGDMCYLRRSVPSQEDQAAQTSGSDAAVTQKIQTNADALWQCFGDGTSMTMQDGAPIGGGNSSLRLLGADALSDNQEHYVSQVISTGEDSPFKKNVLYQVKVWLRQDDLSNGEVMAWISGDFISTGTTFTDVGGAWRQYTYTFFLPSEAAGTNTGEIRFNIGFTGQGTLDIDKVYFGLESNADSSIPASFTSSVIHSSPSLIRLQNVGLGQMGVSSDAWVLPSGNEGLVKDKDGFTLSGGNSLDTSLALVQSTAGADPWLVIGSEANQTTIDNLMSYLCGSISDPYGKLRMENGTAVPWIMQFSNLVIEISDSDGIFSTDLQRGAYVNYMISLIQSSPYYVDNKDKFIFLDGMVYDGGTMLSNADYHTGSLTITSQTSDTSSSSGSSDTKESSDTAFESAVSTGYTSYYDSIPRTPSRSQQGADEWIRSATLNLPGLSDAEGQTSLASGTVSAADYVNILLYDLGTHTHTILSDISTSRNGADADTSYFFSNLGNNKAEKLVAAQNNKTLLEVCSLLNNYSSGTLAEITVSQPIVTTADVASGTSGTSSTVSTSGLITYGFKENNTIHTVVANTSDQPIIFLLESDWSVKNVNVYHYSSEGILLEKTTLGQRNNRINLLPGQVITADMPIQ
jgi:photosystem II stability/assembly factor-like uncharacterized protein